MGATAVLLLGHGLLAIGATFVAVCLRPVGLVGFLLTAITAAWTSLVAVVFLLSPAALVTRGWLLGGLALVAAGSLGAWLACGRPPFPAGRAAAAATVAAVRADAALAALAALVAVGGVYVAALAVATPPFDFDALLYHLPRAALWRQEHAVGYVAGSSDPRLDGNPPAAEIGILLTMVLARGDRFVALPQLVALVSCCLASFGIARRIGLARGEALFGALLVATLPVVAVQATTAYNDLVVAGFLATAAYAALGTTRGDLVLLSLSLGLALTTKPTAVLALPLLVLVAAVGAPRARWAPLLASGACGLVLGAPWYLLNLLETASLDGGLSEDAAQRQTLSLLEVATTLRRHLYSLLDFSGTRALELTHLYGVAAGVVAALGLAAAIVRRRPRLALVGLGAALVVFSPRILLVHLVTVTISWDPWRGRLLAFSFLLSAATWGLVLGRRWLAWGVVALALVTLPLALLDAFGRPVGLAWLDQDRSVWTMPRDSLLEWRMEEGSGAVQAARIVRRVPAGETVAIAPLPGDVLYPLLDPSGARRTLLVRIDGGRVPDEAGWLVVAPGSRVERCGRWRRVADRGGWLVERRAGDGPTCTVLTGGSS